MIMPIGAVPNQKTLMFRGDVRNSEFFEEVVKNFTKMEQLRWESVQKLMKKVDDGVCYDISSDVLQIGNTVIKSVVIKDNNYSILAKEVYDIIKGGSVLLFNKETLARTIFNTFEKIYNS